MSAPIYEFAKNYAESGVSRFHMPGHKGKPLHGLEPLDLTEIRGADYLFGAEGISLRVKHALPHFTARLRLSIPPRVPAFA